MEVSFEHNYTAKDVCVFDCAVIIGGDTNQPINIVIVVDCSYSMKGSPAQLATDVVAAIRLRFGRSTVIHAGDLPRVNPAATVFSPICNGEDALLAAFSYCKDRHRNHIVFVTDGFIKVNSDRFDDFGIPFHIFNVGIGDICGKLLWSALDILSVTRAVDEFAAFVDNTLYTGVSAIINAGDGVRIVAVRTHPSTELVHLKSYRAMIGAISTRTVLLLRVSIREDHANPPVSLTFYCGGDPLCSRKLDLTATSECNHLGTAILSDLLGRLRMPAVTDEVIECVNNGVDFIMNSYPHNPETVALAAVCRSVIGQFKQ